MEFGLPSKSSATARSFWTYAVGAEHLDCSAPRMGSLLLLGVEQFEAGKSGHECWAQNAQIQPL